MNYITEIKAFYDLVQLKQLSTGQIALWHALMYINNKCAWNTWFTAPNLTLQLLTGLSRQSISDNRNVLKQFGLIDFKSNGTKATSYRLKTLQINVQETLQDELQGSLQYSCTLNKLNQTKQKQKKDISISKEKQRHKRGEFGHVLLSDEEIEKLEKDFGEHLAHKAIEYLDEYIEMKGYKHKNSNLAIRKWVIDAVRREIHQKGEGTVEVKKRDGQNNECDLIEEAKRLGANTTWEGWD